MIIFGDHLREPLETALGTTLSPTAQFIGRLKGGKLQVVVGYDNYTGPGVEMFVAAWSEYWPVRSFMRAIFAYPFKQLGCKRVTGLCASDNADAIRMHRKTGFRREGIIREGLSDADIIIFGMLRTECRWIDEQKIR